jgi:hypothetical protein
MTQTPTRTCISGHQDHSALAAAFATARAHLSRGRRTVIAGVAFIAAATLVSSCSLVNKMRPQNDGDKRAAQLQELQLKVMRFADEYAGRILEPIRAFQGNNASPEQRLAAQNWLVQQTTSAYTIATGPNPLTNALDMVVLTTMSDMVVDDMSVANFGDQLHTLRSSYNTLDTESWELLDGIVTPAQLAAVHAALADWRAKNPHVHSVSYVHFRDFVSSPETITSQRALNGSSVLSLLGLDPLSTLDPTVQEFARTRQSVERAMYFMQRTPQLLDMQVERITYQLAVMPESRSLLADFDRTSLAATSAGKLADRLPDVLAQERDATIRQFMGAIQSQQAQMRELLTDMRTTLQAGTAASDSVHQTTRALDAFVAGFRTPPDPNQPPGKPFDITQYTATAHELAVASTQLQGLLAQLNTSGPGVARLTDSAATQLNGVVDRAYRRAVELILILVGASLLAVVLYRLAMRRIARPPQAI